MNQANEYKILKIPIFVNFGDVVKLNIIKGVEVYSTILYSAEATSNILHRGLDFVQ